MESRNLGLNSIAACVELRETQLITLGGTASEVARIAGPSVGGNQPASKDSGLGRSI
jgi:hypothetical protein